MAGTTYRRRDALGVFLPLEPKPNVEAAKLHAFCLAANFLEGAENRKSRKCRRKNAEEKMSLL